MENSRKIEANREIEENILAILDPTGFKDSKDDHDDRLAFLEAVSAACILPQFGAHPTNKMREAIFQIFRSNQSLELMMASYQLLIELDKRFPQVYISNGELVVVKEAWSPFVLGSENASSERIAVDRNTCTPLDSSGFHILVEGLVDLASDTEFKAISLKSLGKMLLLQYLVNVLNQDFMPRNSIFKETKNWIFLRESLLNRLLGSRRMSYKGLIKDFMSVLFSIYHAHAELSDEMRHSQDPGTKPLENCDNALVVCLVEVEKGTCIAIQKLLVMIMELDSSKKQADVQGVTTRADGVRTSVMEIIVDELTYNKDILSPFLQAFDEPKWKHEIVLQYFWKYTAKPALRTRSSNGSPDEATFEGILKCFSNSTSTKSVTKKITAEVSQVLLSHGLQAYFALNIADQKEGVGGCSLVHVCESVISAFRNLKRVNEHVEILPLAKEALFTAATIVSTKS